MVLNLKKKMKQLNNFNYWVGSKGIINYKVRGNKFL